MKKELAPKTPKTSHMAHRLDTPRGRSLVESKGFEPLDVTRTSTVFETAAFSRSANSGQRL